MASFHELGIVPVDNDKLIIFVITGVIGSVHSFNNRVGIGSRSHVFGVLDEMRSDTILIDTTLLHQSDVSSISWSSPTEYKFRRLLFALPCSQVLEKSSNGLFPSFTFNSLILSN